MKNIFHLLMQINSITVLILLIFLITVCLVYRRALKFYIKEIIKIYAVEDSFFSKKRIESGIAFMIAFVITCFYVYKKIDGMDIASFMWILSWWLAISGYTVYQIQKEKKPDSETK